MKPTRIILSAAILLVVISASAQRFQIYGDYSYLHFSPTIGGVQSRQFNGGGGGAQLNFLHIFSIKADFQAYASTPFVVTYPGPIVTPAGTIPAGTYSTHGDLFTYLFGPEFIIPLPKVKPFGEALFGGSQTNAFTNLANKINSAGGSISIPTQHPFTLAAGGGLDIDITKRLGVRLAEFDYVLTRYHNPLTNNSSQNNFRYCGGLILKF